MKDITPKKWAKALDCAPGTHGVSYVGACIKWESATDPKTKHRIEAAYKSLIAEQQVPQSIIMVAKDNQFSPASMDSYNKVLNISPVDMQSAPTDQIKGILLHEAGHWHEQPSPSYLNIAGNINPLFLAVFVLSGIGYGVLQTVRTGARYIWSRKNSSSTRHTLSNFAKQLTGFCGCITIIAGGSAFITNRLVVHAGRKTEAAADIYAVKAQRDARPLQAYFIPLVPDDKIQEKESVLGITPAGIIAFFDPHPGLQIRITAMGNLARSRGWPAYKEVDIKKLIKTQKAKSPNSRPSL